MASSAHKTHPTYNLVLTRSLVAAAHWRDDSVPVFKMARTRAQAATSARRSSRLATRTTQAPRLLISQPPSKPARGRGPSSRGGRLAHAVRQQKGCGVSGQPSLSPSFSVATDSHPHLPPRLLPAPCQSHAIRPHHRCHMQAMTYSPPLLLLLCLPVCCQGSTPRPSAIKLKSAPKASRPPFLLPKLQSHSSSAILPTVTAFF